MIAPASHPESNATAKHLPEKKAPADPLTYVSASRLKNFIGCRLRFFFEKVLDLPRPLAPNLHLGRAVHAGLQHYNLARWRGGDSSEPAVLTAFRAAFDNPEEGATVAWDEPDDKQDAKSKGEAVLSAFLTHQQSVIEPQPMGVEVSVHAELPSLALPLLGVIDLVKADRRTVDYKTVGATPNVEHEVWLHETQMIAHYDRRKNGA